MNLWMITLVLLEVKKQKNINIPTYIPKLKLNDHLTFYVKLMFKEKPELSFCVVL